MKFNELPSTLVIENGCINISLLTVKEYLEQE
jgi:hypothetical protein